MDKIREKIQIMFDGPDQDMWILGKLLCHELRIDYWIELEIDSVRIMPHTKGLSTSFNNWKVIRKVKGYSIIEIIPQTSGGSRKNVYKIKLEKWKD